MKDHDRDSKAFAICVRAAIKTALEAGVATPAIFGILLGNAVGVARAVPFITPDGRETIADDATIRQLVEEALAIAHEFEGVGVA